MQLALHTTFAASRKEPLAVVLERVHATIIAADFGEPQVQFVFSGSPIAGGVSNVARALKRFPSLENGRYFRSNCQNGSITFLTLGPSTE